ncbi:MAG: adenosylmethionine decarboxylase [Sphingomonadales bacterium]
MDLKTAGNAKRQTPAGVPPGTHLLIDLWGARRLQDRKLIESALIGAATACGATVLNIDLHEFGEAAGITGVAILAESHISIHTWPEFSFAAVDVFMCGNLDPHKALEPLKQAFTPSEVNIASHDRGIRAKPAA